MTKYSLPMKRWIVFKEKECNTFYNKKDESFYNKKDESLFLIDKKNLSFLIIFHRAHTYASSSNGSLVPINR